MGWIWENGLSVGISEPIGYGDGYLFSYLIGYRIEFGYRILSSDLDMNSIIPDPNPIHCHPYHRWSRFDKLQICYDGHSHRLGWRRCIASTDFDGGSNAAFARSRRPRKRPRRRWSKVLEPGMKLQEKK